MKSIYEFLHKLEKESIERSKEAKEAGENPEWDDGFLEAIIEIESWIDANRHELEDGYGNLYTVVNADME